MITRSNVIWPNRLRELRIEMSRRLAREVTLAEVAAGTERSISYISRLERAVSRPDRATLQKLAEFYSVAADTIGCREEARPGLSQEKIIGAYLRLKRQAAKRSIEQQRLLYDPPVSSAFVRLCEAGQRAFHAGEKLGETAARLAGAQSIEELVASATRAHGAGELDHILAALHGGAALEASRVSCPLDGSHRTAPVPPHVRERMQQGDYALLMASAVLGPGIPAGAYLVARAEPAQLGAPAVLWDNSVPRAVIATDGGGLRLEPSPRMLDAGDQPLHRVVAIIMPDRTAAPAQLQEDRASGEAA